MFQKLIFPISFVTKVSNSCSLRENSTRIAVGIFLRLTKFFSSVCIAGSAVAGFCIGGGKIQSHALWLFAGLLFLAMGSGALNQIQEIDADRKIDRTKHRPLPAGEISPRFAGIISILLLSLGLSLLFVFQEMKIGFFGILGVAIYNGVYTPLKTKVTWAIFLGAFAGCLPPIMGFLAGGGSETDRMCFFLVGLSYFWQVAHFCILVLTYEKEYEKSEIGNLYHEIGGYGIGILAMVSMGTCFLTVFGRDLHFPNFLFWCGVCLLSSIFFGSRKIFQNANFFHGAFLLWNALLGGGILSIAQGCF
ncbi:MAG: UbiA family prenyltransferase [Candidatus Riflebacteria bacterium]|nr:UbiA family prenyltransferase [Candidatus Riflebacteria bacterium]